MEAVILGKNYDAYGQSILENGCKIRQLNYCKVCFHLPIPILVSCHWTTLPRSLAFLNGSTGTIFKPNLILSSHQHYSVTEAIPEG